MLEVRLMKDKEDFRVQHQKEPKLELFDEDKMNDDEWFKTFDIKQLDLQKLNKYIKI